MLLQASMASDRTGGSSRQHRTTQLWRCLSWWAVAAAACCDARGSLANANSEKFPKAPLVAAGIDVVPHAHGDPVAALARSDPLAIGGADAGSSSPGIRKAVNGGEHTADIARTASHLARASTGVFAKGNAAADAVVVTPSEGSGGARLMPPQLPLVRYEGGHRGADGSDSLHMNPASALISTSDEDDAVTDAASLEGEEDGVAKALSGGSFWPPWGWAADLLPGGDRPRGPGQKGREGADGPAGKRGRRGNKGTPGSWGKEGAPGESGVDGKQGPPGARGDTGPEAGPPKGLTMNAFVAAVGISFGVSVCTALLLYRKVAQVDVELGKGQENQGCQQWQQEQQPAEWAEQQRDPFGPARLPGPPLVW